MKKDRAVVANALVIAGVILSLVMILTGISPKEINLYFEQFRMWIFGGAVHADHLSMTLTLTARVLFILIGVGGIVFALSAWKPLGRNERRR